MVDLLNFILFHLMVAQYAWTANNVTPIEYSPPLRTFVLDAAEIMQVIDHKERNHYFVEYAAGPMVWDKGAWSQPLSQVNELYQTWRAVRNLPYDGEANLPSYAVADANVDLINAFSNHCRAMMSVYPEEHFIYIRSERAAARADQLNSIWNMVRMATSPTSYMGSRRYALEELRKAVGYYTFYHNLQLLDGRPLPVLPPDIILPEIE